MASMLCLHFKDSMYGADRKAMGLHSFRLSYFEEFYEKRKFLLTVRIRQLLG